MVYLQGSPRKKLLIHSLLCCAQKNWWGMLKSSCLTITEYTRSGAKYQGQFV